MDKPASVPLAAVFDADEDVWVLDAGGDGDTKRWDAAGLLRHVETYEDRELVRIREYLADGSLAQDSVLFDNGVPRRKWFRRTQAEQLASFPAVHADALEVQYLFDEHGRMHQFRIVGAAGAVIEEQTLYRNARNDTEQARFPSIEATATAWTAEGDRFTRELNRWIDELNTGDRPAFPEPFFERDDLERPVVDAVAALNEAGAAAQARAMFPLYHDGIGAAFWDRFGLVVDAVIDAGFGTTYARVHHPSRGAEVYRITQGSIDRMPGMLAFGASPDKRTLAYAFADRIEVHRGTESLTLPYPGSYQHPAADAATPLGSGAAIGVRSLRVAPSGREVVVVGSAGVFVVGAGRSQRLYPLDESLDELLADGAGITMHFANADISPAGDRITCGALYRPGIFAGLAIYRREGDRWFVENTSTDPAFFPAQAVFHRSRPHIAFAACLYASLSNRLLNTTFRIDLEDLAPGELDRFGGAVMRDMDRVQAIAAFGDGYLLGFTNGYVRWMGIDEPMQRLGHIYVGGSVQALDVSADHRSFVVATDAGVVSRFTLADVRARNLITDLPLTDDGRTCFFRTYAPLRW